jgi:adenylate kinase family enzyme
MPAPAVIVTGSPGSGKSVVARALADGEARSAHVESDWFFRFLRADFIPPYEGASADQNAVVMDIVCDAVIGYATAGYTVYWDGIVGPWFLEQVLTRLGGAGVEASYVVLRPARDIALERVRGRDGEVSSSGVETMYEQFSDLDAFESHVVSADAPVGEVVELVRRGLRESTFRIGASR